MMTREELIDTIQEAFDMLWLVDKRAVSKILSDALDAEYGE